MSAWAAWSFQPPDTLSEESTLPVFELAVVFICLACGGILKGATGAGAVSASGASVRTGLEKLSVRPPPSE